MNTSDGRWITINGVHVFIDKSGTITKGPKHVIGTNINKAKDIVKKSSYSVDEWNEDSEVLNLASRHKNLRKMDLDWSKEVFNRVGRRELSEAYGEEYADKRLKHINKLLEDNWDSLTVRPEQRLEFDEAFPKAPTYDMSGRSITYENQLGVYESPDLLKRPTPYYPIDNTYVMDGITKQTRKRWDTALGSVQKRDMVKTLAKTAKQMGLTTAQANKFAGDAINNKIPGMSYSQNTGFIGLVNPITVQKYKDK